MKNKNSIIALIVVVILLGGFLLFKSMSKPQDKPPVVEDTPIEEIEPLDPAVVVDLTKSRLKDNTVVLSINGLGSKYTSVSYELSYESQSIVQGVTSKPLDVSGKDTFTRDDIYLGTCSRNVCRPHAGVKKISVTLEFTSLSGKKSQFSRDYDL